MSEKTVIDDRIVLENFQKLTSKGKKEAADFIAYLKIKEEIEATKEIISDKDFLDSIMRGEKDIAEGRFKRWTEVREDV